MSKKRVKEKSVENNFKKSSKWWVWLVLGILVLIIVFLVIFILLSKSSGLKTACEIAGMNCYMDSCPSGYEQTNSACKSGNVCCKKTIEESPCEKYNNTCYNSSCPSGTIMLDLGCEKTGKVCCKNFSTYQTPCQKQGNICLRSSLPEPACPSGYAEVDLGCIFGEICCKKTLTPCETARYTCKDACTTIEEPKNFACNAGQKCCDYIIRERGDCEKAGYRCQYSSCNSGYTKMGICGDDYFCCTKDTTPKLVIHGFVKLKQGNCMPPTNPTTCKEDVLDAYVGIFPIVHQSELDGPYYRSTIEPMIFERSIKNGVTGYYEIEVPKGTYSIFAQDPLNFNDYYCNNFDSNGNACVVTVDNTSVSFDIIIDHATY